MSQLLVLTTAIENPDLETLKECLAHLAEKLDMELTRTGIYWHLRAKRYDSAAQRTNDISIEVQRGRVKVIGDDWHQNTTLKDFEKMLVQEYTTQTTVNALKEQGFQVYEDKTKEGEVILEAELW